MPERDFHSIVSAILAGSPEREPRELGSERYVLGAMLADSPSVEYTSEHLRAEDFYLPNHQLLARLLFELAAEGSPTDHYAALQQAVHDGHTAITWQWINELQAALPLGAGTLGYHVERVRNAAERRSLLVAAVRLAVTAQERHDLPAADLVAIAHERLDAVVAAGSGGHDKPRTLREYLAVEQDYNWVIPGLLERRERLLVTGYEGRGKSVFLRQLAVAAAAGLHPFTNDHLAKPVRTLVIDCENPRALNQRKYRPLALAAYKLRQYPDELYLESPGHDLDLTDVRDQGWVTRQVRTIEPDILIIGPIYKLHSGATNEEETPRKVIGFLDKLINRWDCALVMEAHAPWGEPGSRRPLRPIGSSIWTRWPDFGLGLRPVGRDRPDRLTRLELWKPRDERDWPPAIRGGGDWPWIPVSADELETLED